jgi:hypothetical protein
VVALTAVCSRVDAQKTPLVLIPGFTGVVPYPLPSAAHVLPEMPCHVSSHILMYPRRTLHVHGVVTYIVGTPTLGCGAPQAADSRILP